MRCIHSDERLIALDLKFRRGAWPSESPSYTLNDYRIPPCTARQFVPKSPEAVWHAKEHVGISGHTVMRIRLCAEQSRRTGRSLPSFMKQLREQQSFVSKYVIPCDPKDRWRKMRDIIGGGIARVEPEVIVSRCLDFEQIREKLHTIEWQDRSVSVLIVRGARRILQSC